MDLTGWTPVRVHWRSDAPSVEWRWTGGARFTDPFFEQSMERAVRRPFSLLFPVETPIETLRDEAARTATPDPDGFVFHVSRCGSTLVSQMLAADPRVLVISEASPIEGILRARHAGVPDETACEWLRWLVGVLGRPVAGETGYVLKLDSWSSLDLPLFERAFPDTPWVFVYRDPAEVLASHLRQPGPQVLPGVLPPEVVGLNYQSLAEITLEEYAALVLQRIAAAGLEHARGRNGLLIEHRDLPAAVTERIVPHFGLEPGEAALAAMAAASVRDAKNPAIPYEPDSEAKRSELSEVAQGHVEQLLRPVYEGLEAARTEALAC